MKVHKGDTVLVIAGKDKGAKGKVIAADPFTITIRKAAWASEIKNVLRPAENTRYLLVSADITATGDTFVAWPLLYSSIDIEAEGKEAGPAVEALAALHTAA